MQISRLFEIVMLLLDKKMLTAGELARHFGVSSRTIYRDIDALSQAGIPVYASQGKNGGIALMESYVLQKSLLSREEQTEVLAAIQGLSAIGATKGAALLTKWRALFGAGEGEWVAVDFSDWSQTRQGEVQLIKEAILQHKALRFAYYGSSGEKTEREVYPLQLWFKSRAWYVKAYCCMRRGIRLFKLTRMKNVRLSGESFSREGIMAEQEQETPGDARPCVVLSLWIDGALAFRVYDEFEESQVQRLPCGHFHVTAAYPEDEWVYGFLLSFGPYLRVVSPPHIQKILKSRLEKMRTYYG